MNRNIDVTLDRNIFKRSVRPTDDENSLVVKKPTLVNPLQEVSNSVTHQEVKPVVELNKEEKINDVVPSIQQIIDEHDKENQTSFAFYAQRIVNSWLIQEDRFRCLPNYLDGQHDVRSYMRETMIDWLVDVNSKCHHHRETLYLCVNIVDRYVYYSIRDKTDCVSRSDYQLVGVAAYLIASKYEEIYYPEIHHLLQFAENAYNEEDVKRMELKIVNTLKYDLTVPTSNKFLGRFLRMSSNKNVHFMCYLICDRMLQSLPMLNWKPSIQASASIYLARRYLGYDDGWNESLEEFSGVKKQELMPCAIAIHAIIRNPSKLDAVKRKYSSPRFNRIYDSIPIQSQTKKSEQPVKIEA